MHGGGENKVDLVAFGNGVGNTLIMQFKGVVAVLAHDQLADVVGVAGFVLGGI